MSNVVWCVILRWYDCDDSEHNDLLGVFDNYDKAMNALSIAKIKTGKYESVEFDAYLDRRDINNITLEF